MVWELHQSPLMFGSLSYTDVFFFIGVATCIPTVLNVSACLCIYVCTWVYVCITSQLHYCNIYIPDILQYLYNCEQQLTVIKTNEYSCSFIFFLSSILGDGFYSIDIALPILVLTSTFASPLLEIKHPRYECLWIFVIKSRLSLRSWARVPPSMKSWKANTTLTVFEIRKLRLVTITICRTTSSKY